NTNWLVFFSEYINIWENRYDHILTHEPIIIPELAACRITCHGLGSMVSHICCQKSRGVGKSVSKG
ncbi:hypothetical protein Godav_006433, partial [Gossypium davidsonii]|nr:hypothetical protein [Gossypium davidsonii]